IRTALLVFRGDSNAPVHERASSASVVPASGRLRPIERPVAISQDGRFLALDVTQLPSAGGGAPPAMSARASVLDLERNQVIVALPSRTLRPEPLGSWEVDGADDQTAAFDVSGTRVVFVRDAPDCQMVTEMTMSWLPIKVPGCTQHRISFSLWDLQTREQIAEMVLVKETGSRMSSPALSAMIGAILPMNLLLASVPAMRLDLPEPARVSLSAAEAAVTGEQSSRVLEISEVRESVTIRQDSTGPLAACARLPPELSRTDPAAWAALLPLESYRPICPAVR